VLLALDVLAGTGLLLEEEVDWDAGVADDEGENGSSPLPIRRMPGFRVFCLEPRPRPGLFRERSPENG